MKISCINYGIGFRHNESGKPIIELNKHLKKYPELHQSVLDHELEHARLNNNYIDFWHDLKALFSPIQIELIKFSLRHPSALLSSSPIFFTKKGIAVNLFMLSIWGATLLAGLGIWRIL